MARQRPWWVGPVLIAITSALLVVLAFALQKASGLGQWIALIAVALFSAALAFVPHLTEQRRSEKLRLTVEIAVKKSPLGFVTMPEIVNAATAECEQELAVLTTEPVISPETSEQDPSPQVSDDEADPTGSTDLSGVTLHDIRSIETKIEQGIELTPDEQRVHDAWQATVTSKFAAVRSRSNWLTDPDTRSFDEFCDQCRSYTQALHPWLVDSLLWRSVHEGYGAITLTIANPKDFTLEGVEVRLVLPRSVGVLDPEEQPRESAAPPTRPRPFGEGASKFAQALRFGSQVRPWASPALPDVWAPTVEYREDHVQVTFAPQGLRALDTVELPPIVLVALEPWHEPVQASWTATANNAPGRDEGAVTVTGGGNAAPIQTWIDELMTDL